MQIYFIRHGESTNNDLMRVSDNYQAERSPSPTLSSKGYMQAELLAARLSTPYTVVQPQNDYQNHQGFGLTHLYCSMMVRAIETALPSAKALGLPLTALPMLHEFGGIFEYDGMVKRIGLAGETRDELLAMFPTLTIAHEVAEGGWWDGRVENSAELYQRAGAALDYMLNNHDDDAIVAFVSHGEFYSAFMANLLGLKWAFDPQNPTKVQHTFGINNTGITRILINKHGKFAIYSNSTSHLPAHLITR